MTDANEYNEWAEWDSQHADSTYDRADATPLPASRSGHVCPLCNDGRIFTNKSAIDSHLKDAHGITDRIARIRLYDPDLYARAYNRS